MMMNLFSMFDPSSMMNFSLNWISSMMGVFMMPMMFWLIPSRINILWLIFFFLLNKEFKLTLNTKTSSSSLMFISFFLLILFNNFMSLFPYIFSSSSHLVFSLTLSLSLWLSLMLYGWINNHNHMFYHMIPKGTPNMLMPFMVCIELVSNIIRPLTLSVRLSANMIAGHLILSLIGSLGNKLSFTLLNMMILLQLILLILELSVSIIQSYVFSILGTLYLKEIN